MAYIDTSDLFKCETCRHCIGEYKCNTYCDSGECYSPNMSKIPTADVVPKSEVSKALLDLKRQIHDKATYPHGKDTYAFVNLKVFDAVLNNILTKYTEGEK